MKRADRPVEGDGLPRRRPVSIGYDKHVRINRTRHFSHLGVPINGIEASWSYTKRRLTKFNGVKKNFVLHLKGCEWRFNKNVDQLQKELGQMITRAEVS